MNKFSIEIICGLVPALVNPRFPNDFIMLDANLKQA